MNAPQPASEFERHMATGRHLLAARSYARAAESFRQAIASQPEDAYAHAHLASALNQLKQHKEAAREVEIALGIDAEDAYCHGLSSRISIARNQWKQAHRSVEQAISLEPQNAHHHVLLAWIWNHRVPLWDSNIPKAETAARRALELAPHNVEGHRVLGNILKRRGKKAEARAHFETALSLDPENSAAHSSLGGLLMEEGSHPQRVLGHVQESLRQDPNDRATQNMLSVAQTANRWYPLKMKVWNATFARIPIWIHKPLAIAMIVCLMPLPGIVMQSSGTGSALVNIVLIAFIFVCVFILTAFNSWFGHGPQE